MYGYKPTNEPVDDDLEDEGTLLILIYLTLKPCCTNALTSFILQPTLRSTLKKS